MIAFQRSESNQETADKIKELGHTVHIVTCDLSSKDDVSTVVNRITGSKSEGGLELNIDILVNCGGIQRRYNHINQHFWSTTENFYRHPSELFPDEDWQTVCH